MHKSQASWEVYAERYRQTSEACSPSKWATDEEVDACQHPGCRTRFGYFGLPGVELAVGMSTRRGKAGRGKDEEEEEEEEEDNKGEEKSGDVATRWTSPWRSQLVPSTSSSSSSVSSLTTTTRATTAPASSVHLLPNKLVASLRIHRRHHCRRCGLIFYQAHSSRTASLMVVVEEEGEGEGEEEKRKKDAPASTSIRARVCDGCYDLCRRVQLQYERALIDPEEYGGDDDEGSSTGPFRRPSLASYLSSTTSTSSSSSSSSSHTTPSPSTPNLISPIATTLSPKTKEEDEEHREFLSSRLRLHREMKRENREAIRLLCNDPTANRIVAAAAMSRAASATLRGAVRAEAADHQDQHHHCEHSSFSSTTTYLSLPPIITTKTTLLVNATPWEKIEAKRREQEIARRALSLEAFEKQQVQMMREEMLSLQEEWSDSIYSGLGEKEEHDEAGEEDDEERECRSKLENIIRRSKEKPFSRSYYGPAAMMFTTTSPPPLLPHPHHHIHRRSSCHQEEQKSMGLLRIRQHNEQRDSQRQATA